MHREELKNSDFKQTQLASLQVELGSKLKQSKFSANRLELARNTTSDINPIMDEISVSILAVAVSDENRIFHPWEFFNSQDASIEVGFKPYQSKI